MISLGTRMNKINIQQEQMLDFINKLNRFEELYGGEIKRGNIFAAAGLVRQEVRHSTILAFLLDPRGWHGLGNFLLRRIVYKASENLDTSARLKISYLKLEVAIVKTEVTISGSSN